MNTNIKAPNIETIAQTASMSSEEVTNIIELVKRSMVPQSRRICVIEGGKARYYLVERRGVGILSTEHGKFWQYNFAIDDQWIKYSVIVKSTIDDKKLIPIFRSMDKIILRTDSGCETGQVFGDLTCECGVQLSLAMKKLSEEGEGIIVNIPHQDGRGMGLTFKLATLWLQESLGVNTVDSAALLAPGGVIDIRTYAGVICILKFFEIPLTCKINLATNNPSKADVFAENGYAITDYTSVIIEPNDHTRVHLEAKKEFLGHRDLSKKGDV